MYIYYANDIVHDGHLAGVQWNTLPPRSTSVIRPANVAPIAPEELGINKDYQGRDIFDNFTPIGEYCEQNCLEAAVAVGKGAEGCIPSCPAEALLCADGEVKYEATGTGPTESEASIAALLAAALATPESCDPDYYPCYVYWDANIDEYKAAVAFCCPPESST
jgi:hypothetical protein